MYSTNVNKCFDSKILSSNIISAWTLKIYVFVSPAQFPVLLFCTMLYGTFFVSSKKELCIIICLQIFLSFLFLTISFELLSLIWQGEISWRDDDESASPLIRSVYFAVGSILRILVFSPAAITSVTVYIDGVRLGNAHQASGPLYVLKWSPQNYSEGTHQIDVTVQVRYLLAFFVLNLYIVMCAISLHVTRGKMHDNWLDIFLMDYVC